MSEPVFYIDKSEIRHGKLDELKAAIIELADFVAANEPQLISYNFYFDEEGTRMTVVGVHPDSASMEFHMKVAGPAFRRFTEYINLSGIEVYGEVSDTLLKQLRQKAQMLGSGTVLVDRLYAGFSRLEAR